MEAPMGKAGHLRGGDPGSVRPALQEQNGGGSGQKGRGLRRLRTERETERRRDQSTLFLSISLSLCPSVPLSLCPSGQTADRDQHIFQTAGRVDYGRGLVAAMNHAIAAARVAALVAVFLP